MPIRFSIEMLPVGVSWNHAFEGETVRVRTREFMSSEDGNTCINRLDGFTECYQKAFAPHGPHLPSQVDHFLAIVTRDRHVTAFCNELSTVVTFRKQVRVLKDGEPVWRSDVVDVETIELQDSSGNRIEIPDDCGVAWVFSVGWRKGVYYDYSVFGCGKPAADRTENLPRLFGRFYARVLFQDLFSISEEQWARLITWGWFPFIGVHAEERKKLIGWASQDREPIPVFRQICERFKAGIHDRIDAWKHHELLQPHAEFIASARELIWRTTTLVRSTCFIPASKA